MLEAAADMLLWFRLSFSSGLDWARLAADFVSASVHTIGRCACAGSLCGADAGTGGSCLPSSRQEELRHAVSVVEFMPPGS